MIVVDLMARDLIRQVKNSGGSDRLTHGCYEIRTSEDISIAENDYNRKKLGLPREFWSGIISTVLEAGRFEL